MRVNKRYTVLDCLRGVAIISMVVYHTLWDMVNIFSVRIPWFRSDAATFWQLSIRWAFILLSGFCWSMSKIKLKRALTVLGCSVIITVATAVFMPNNFIKFGVLSLIGTGMLITIPLDKFFRKISPVVGLILLIFLFVVTVDAELGRLSISDWLILRLPDELYANYFTAYIGFPPSSFSSSDYVPIIPWIFMYWIGYFIYLIFEKKDMLKYLCAVSFKPLEWLGKHSLVIYMLHQPIVYAVLFIFFKIR